MTSSPSCKLSLMMDRALHLAHQAFHQQEVPVGAILYHTVSGETLAQAHNLTTTRHDPTAHAEMLVIQEGCRKLVENTPSTTPHISLQDYTLTVTLEPCAMCAQAMSWAKLGRLVFGAYDPKSGGVDHGARVFSHSTCHHKPMVIGGVQESACGKILTKFFQELR